MSIGYTEIMKKLNEIGRPDLIAESAVRRDDFLVSFVKKLEPKVANIIEIGTYNGFSALTLASIGKIVYTYDVAYRGAEFVWNLFGMEKKIRCCVAPQWQIDFEIKNTIVKCWKDKFNFNFAFIDGEHTEKAVRHDFELVKFCGRVLFDNANFPELKRFVIDEIGGKVEGVNSVWGYWEGTKCV